MDATEIVEVAHDPPAIETLALSPDARASLVINLIAEITVTGIAEDQHDLSLFFLTFQPAAIAALQRLVPALVNVSPTLIYAQTFLGLASAPERTRSEATKARVEPSTNEEMISHCKIKPLKRCIQLQKM